MVRQLGKNLEEPIWMVLSNGAFHWKPVHGVNFRLPTIQTRYDFMNDAESASDEKINELHLPWAYGTHDFVLNGMRSNFRHQLVLPPKQGKANPFSATGINPRCM